MTKPTIQRLKATKQASGSGIYKVESRFDSNTGGAGTQQISSVSTYHNNTEINIDITNLDNTKQYFEIDNIYFDFTTIMTDDDLLDITTKKQKRGANHAGISIKPTKYPPPYKPRVVPPPSVRKEGLGLNSINTVFEIDEFEVLRTTQNMFSTNIKLSYTGTTNYVENGIAILNDNTHTYNSSPIKVLVISVTTGTNTNKTIDYSLANQGFNQFIAGQGMAVIITDQDINDIANFDWSLIDTKLAFVSFEYV